MMLKDKVAIITGAASGIGFGTAKRFLEEGAKVVICDVNQENIDKAVEALSEFGEVAGYVADITNKAKCDELAETVNAKFGLGWIIQQSSSRGRTDLVFMAIITIVIVSVVFDTLSKTLVKNIFKWRCLNDCSE